MPNAAIWWLCALMVLTLPLSPVAFVGAWIGELLLFGGDSSGWPSHVFFVIPGVAVAAGQVLAARALSPAPRSRRSPGGPADGRCRLLRSA